MIELAGTVFAVKGAANSLLKLKNLGRKHWTPAQAEAQFGAGPNPGATPPVPPAAVGAPRNVARTNFNQYEVVSEVPISGTTRGAHRAAANRNLAQQLDANPQLQGQLNVIFGQDVLQHMNSGAGRNLLNLPGGVWHHPIDNPNVMQLLRQGEHTNPLLQPILHPGPNRTGGFGTHFGG